jgi:hypothetical protein
MFACGGADLRDRANRVAAVLPHEFVDRRARRGPNRSRVRSSGERSLFTPATATDQALALVARTCRAGGCGEPARLRGFCPDCWGSYLRERRAAETRLEVWSLAVRAEVEAGLAGAPALWDGMTLNLAAWRSLTADERGRPHSDWFAALIDTLAEAVGL